MSHSMRLSAFLFTLGMMLLVSGGTYGLITVTVVSGTSCGSAFVGSSDAFSLTESGDDACAQARSDRQARAWSLIAPGVVGMLIGGIGMAQDNRAAERTRRQQRAVDV